jgi:MFS family permease
MLMVVDTKAAAGEGRGLDFTGKLVILLSGILSALSIIAINAVLPDIQRDLARGPNDAMLVKQLVGGVILAMAAGAPLGGYLADRLGLRRTLLGASVLYTVAGTAGLYLSSLPLLLVSRLLLGLAAASIQVLGLTMVNTMLEGNARAKWMGLHVSVAMFGTLLIYPVTGQLGEIDWRLPFSLYFGGAVLIFGLMFGRSDGETQAAPALRVRAAEAGPGIISWFPWHYLLLAFLIGSVTYLPTVSIPFQLRQQAGATPSVISYVLTAASLLGAIMALLYGRARLRISAHAAFVISFGLAGAGALVAANAPSFAGVLGGILMLNVGCAWFVPNIMTALGSKVTKERQGRAAGLVKAAHFIAAPVSVALVQPFVKQYGEVIAMQVVGVIAVVMFIVMVLRMTTAGKPKPVAAE